MYKTFVSIAFAFILGFLLLPIQRLQPFQLVTASTQPTSATTSISISEPPGAILVGVPAAFAMRSLLMLGVIVTLWWWYAIFLARVHPTETPLMYLLDFLVFTAVALAAKFWPDA